MIDLMDPEKKLEMCQVRVQQLETCYKINSLLNSELNQASLLDTIMNIAKQVMDADASSLLLIDKEHGDLVFQVALSSVGNQLKTLARLKIGEGIAGTVAETGEPVMIKDAYEHPKFNPAYDKKTGFRTGSILCAPLKVKGEIIGVCQVIHSKDNGKVFVGPDLALFQMFCDSAALALQNARMHQMMLEKQRMEKDMEFAQSVQESFLPASLPQIEGFSFATKALPAREVGGDYYDFIEFEGNKVGILLGDVSGKGVPAALQMARLMSDFRYIAHLKSEPADVLTEVNNILCSRSYRGMFTTVIYLLLDKAEKSLKAANAGHHPILVIGEDKQIQEKVPASGSPLGILPDSQYGQEEISLDSGDQIFLYTDGLIEPKNKNNEQFGFERLTGHLQKNEEPLDKALDQLVDSINQFTGNQPPFDDLTIVGCQVK